MAWPFSSAAAPTFDTGFVAMPQGAAPQNPAGVADGTQYWVMGANFANSGADDEFITLTDGSGNPVIPSLLIPANGVRSLEWAFMPITGLRWQATGPVIGKVWGYQ